MRIVQTAVLLFGIFSAQNAIAAVEAKLVQTDSIPVASDRVPSALLEEVAPSDIGHIIIARNGKLPAGFKGGSSGVK